MMDNTPSEEGRNEEFPTLDDTPEFPLSQSAAPLEIDDGAHENQHSLPNPEELKVDNPTYQNSKSNPVWWFLIIIVLLASAVVALSFGLTADKRNDQKDSSTSGSSGSALFGKDRKLVIEKYLLTHKVSTEGDFEDSASPQSLALNFMAINDKMSMKVPSGDLQTIEGYKFITRYIMTLFYYAMNGSRWNYDLLFLSEHDTCEWYGLFRPPIGQVGVLCNQNTNVIVGFSFLTNALEGSLPSELGHLTTMSYVELIGNEVTGNIPIEYSRLTNLRTIVFAHNLLTGTLPNWITKISNLEIFFVSNNMFSGSIPDDFANLKEIALVALDDNQLTGSLEFLWELPKLKYAFMEDNEFTGSFPTSIVDTSGLLVNLDLSNNKLDGALPADLFRLSTLEVLDLHSNAFDGAIPNDIKADYDKLNFLALYGNLLSSSIPDTIGNLRGLKHLDLSSNDLTGAIPLALDELNKLTYLFLAENDFTEGTIPTFVYSNNNLKELSLKSTKRTGQISELIGLLDKLVLLDLDDNELNGPIPSEIGNMKELQFLLLNRNQLSQAVPTELGKLDKLRFLLLDRNELTGSAETLCMKNMSFAIVDCDEVECTCCDPCCDDQTDCHDYNMLANKDPVWESGYDRQFFDFGDSTLWATTDDDEFGGTR